MALPDLVPVLAATGAVAGVGSVLHYGSKAVLRLVAGITAIAAKDAKRSRAERALDVLRELRSDRAPPPAPASGERAG